MYFDKSWKIKNITELVNNNSYLEFGMHDDLKALSCCPFAEDDDFYNSDYFELTFVVPKQWLIETAKEMFDVTNIDEWLQSEYTTDESEIIFARALDERKVVMVEFN